MHVMFYEPRGTGHHLPYVRHAATCLRSFCTKLTFVTSANVPKCELFRINFGDGFQLDQVDASAPALKSSGFEKSQIFCEGLAAALHKHRPNRVYIPSADQLVLQAGLRPRFFTKEISRGCPMECGIHESIFRRDGSIKRMFLTGLRTLLLNRITNAQFYTFDGFAHDVVQNLRLVSPGKVGVMPLVVPQVKMPSQFEAREILGLPTQGNIVGIAGALAHGNKGYDEVLRAMQEQNSNDFSLLLAGRLSDKLRSRLMADFTSWLDDGRLLLLDRFLSDYHLLLAIRAMNLSLALYRNFFNVSSIVMLAASVGTPSLVPRIGWFNDMFKEFPLGWTIGKGHVSTSYLSQLLNREIPDQSSEKLRRLVKFSASENYAATWAEQAAKSVGADHQPALKWRWVLQGNR